MRRWVRLLTIGLLAAGSAAHAQPAARTTLPGISYEVLGSGPAGGPHPTRADTITMRYVGRLADGEVFSTSPGDGKEVSTFPVGQLIPGMNAALQLMRPGDHWRITMPPYLAYGPGRPLAPATAPPATTPTGPAAQVVQRRGIPPNATLVFDVELVAIVAAKAP
jgi:FKBP-type peptidyl-prolyl cis-trans isomerase